MEHAKAVVNVVVSLLCAATAYDLLVSTTGNKLVALLIGLTVFAFYFDMGRRLWLSPKQR
jgi:hypothetical protein